jgi:proline iminopeptidase
MSSFYYTAKRVVEVAPAGFGARLVTHYWLHAAFLEEGALLRDAGRLDGIPGVLIQGGRDLGAPIDVPWQLSKMWRGSELVVADAGHGADRPGLRDAVIAAIDRFATPA